MFLSRSFIAVLFVFGAVFSSSFLLAQKPITAEETNNSKIEIETYKSGSIIPLLPLLNEWAVREFAQYPYLYSASKDQVVCPSDILFVNSSDSMIGLAKKEGKVVGMVALICFDSPELHKMYFVQGPLLDKFQKSGFDLSKMLYVGYFLTAPELHNDARVVHALYKRLADFAQEKGKTQICYMEDIGQPDHSKATKSVAIEPWGEVIHGFKRTGVQIGITWPTIGENDDIKEKEHTLEFFVKDLKSEERK